MRKVLFKDSTFFFMIALKNEDKQSIIPLDKWKGSAIFFSGKSTKAANGKEIHIQKSH